MVSTRSQRIPLSSLTALTLHSDRRTASRRLAPDPQLTCKGSACRKYQPDVVQCIAVGSDGAGGLEWKCEADLPNGVRFGEIGVSCEGWDGPDDPYIVRGSCGLTYSLVRSSAHLEGGGYASVPSWSKSYLPGSAGSLFNNGFNLLFSLVTLYIVASFLTKLLAPLWRRFRFPGAGRLVGGPHAPGNGGPGGGHGGGGGGGGPGRPPFPPSGPPPPYTPAPKPDPNDGMPNAGWRPGFFTGAALGWAANALMGSTRPRRMEPVEYGAYPGMREGGFWGVQGGGGVRQRGWGLGGGAPRANVRDWDDDRDRGLGTSGMRRSTGFGGTSVR